MRYISFNYSRLDRFRQAISVSYMVTVGVNATNLYLQCRDGVVRLDDDSISEVDNDNPVL